MQDAGQLADDLDAFMQLERGVEHFVEGERFVIHVLIRFPSGIRSVPQALDVLQKSFDIFRSGGVVFHFGIGALIWWAAGFTGFFFGFLLPFILVLALGSYLFYAQHNFPGVTFADKDGWTYADAALDSSSHMKMTPVMRWFLANIGYHHIHHLNPRIPFYRLPEVHRAIPELQHAKTTSLWPWDVVKCLRLKVWDPVQQRMIGRREIYA